MALTAAENQAIINFVQAGGGVIFLGDSGLSTPINTLLGQWGIQFDRTLIGSLQTTCLGCFFLNSFVDHPAMATDPSFYTNYGGSLTISGEAVALGFTSAAEWRSLSELPTKQPAEASGPFVMVAAAQAGRGRVFVVSDDAFHDDYIRSISRVGNLNLFLSALAWLSASVNATPPPTVPVTTTTSTTAQVSTTTAITATTTTRTVTTATSTTTTTTSSSTTTTTTTTLPPGQANVIDFAHIAVGGPYRAFLTLNNPGTGAVSATILFRQPNAYPLSLTISGVAGSSRAITLPAKGLLRLNLEDPGTNIKTGWCQVFSSAPINGLLVYQLLSEQAIVSEASVLPSTRARGFMLPVSQLGAESLTGLALAAVDTQPAQISLRFYRPDGVVLSTSSLTLKSGEGISRFLTEFIPGLAATQEGTLEIVSDRTLIAVALLFQGSVFTSLPVTPLP
jgi:hypothetical protein